ncbi:MAG: hypothetical protein ACI4S2_02215 [Lachnospiraceae bacterium]
MIEERILKYPGFIYDIGGKYYFLGKWICKESTELEANDCLFMYQMSRRQNEEPDTNMYFQKIRAYSDFALEIPYNPVQIKEDMEALIGGLSDTAIDALKKQITCFEEDYPKYCGKILPE